MTDYIQWLGNVKDLGSLHISALRPLCAAQCFLGSLIVSEETFPKPLLTFPHISLARIMLHAQPQPIGSEGRGYCDGIHEAGD